MKDIRPAIHTRSLLIGWLVALCACWLAWSAPIQAQPRGPVYRVQISGTITSATAEYILRALQTAQAASSSALIISMSSTGGVLRDVRPLASAIEQATVPVVVFVTPAGTNAGPTGTLLLSAAHISAMAPDTSFGSAYPLSQVDQALSQQTRDLVLDSVTSQLRDWNAERGRNITWLDQAVRDGAILTNQQAIALNPPAVDLIASDEPQLLTLLEGRTVHLANGSTTTLETLGQTPRTVEPTLWESLRQALAEPTIAFALLIIGALCVYLEFAAPGTALFAGVGVVFILAALFGLFALPVQAWAMALLIGALILLGAEFLVPIHGALATLGLVLLIISGLNLIDPMQAPGTSVALWAIIAIALGLAVFVVLGVVLAMRVRARPVTTGQEGMIGMVAEVRQPLNPQGMVYVDGALWRAISEDGSAAVGEHVRVIGIHNLQLIVRRLESISEASVDTDD